MNNAATETINIKCGKCGGKGILNAFLHVAGGRCYTCKGVGHFVTTKARETAKAHKAAAARASEEARLAPILAAAEISRSDAATDPRVGPKTRARVVAHPAFASQTASHLAKWDADPSWIDARPWIRENLAE